MKREQWTSTMALILVIIGSAVGLGNFWRFPYLVGQNGGGAFLIAYIACSLLIGLPVMWIELAVGRKFQTSLLEIYKKLEPKLEFLAVFPFLMVFIIFSFYIVITGWTLYFFTNSLMGDGIDFSIVESGHSSVYFMIFALVLSAIPIVFGIKKGIERASRLLVPLLFILVILLVVFALGLPNADKGLEFYLTCDFSHFTNLNVWVLALSQSIFSLSVGAGVILTYASYSKAKEHIIKNSLMIGAADISIAFLAGLFIFPAVFSFGFDPAQGPALTFTVLPQIFSMMPHGWFVGPLFFLCLFIAGLTSSISLFEFVVTNFVDYIKINRKKAIIAGFVIVLILALPSALSYSQTNLQLLGMKFLDAVDHYFVALTAPLSIIIICSLVWIWNKKEFVKEIDWGSNIKAGKYAYLWVKYIVPIAGLILLADAVMTILAV